MTSAFSRSSCSFAASSARRLAAVSRSLRRLAMLSAALAISRASESFSVMMRAMAPSSSVTRALACQAASRALSAASRLTRTSSFNTSICVVSFWSSPLPCSKSASRAAICVLTLLTAAPASCSCRKYHSSSALSFCSVSSFQRAATSASADKRWISLRFVSCR